MFGSQQRSRPLWTTTTGMGYLIAVVTTLLAFALAVGLRRDLAVVAFVVVAVTITVTMEALRRARSLADSRAPRILRDSMRKYGASRVARRACST